MKKSGILCLVVMMFSVSLSGCGVSSNVDTNTMYVGSNGKITDVTVEDFDKDYYDKDELKDYIDDAVDAYNKNDGTGTVKVKKQEVKKNVAKLMITYDSYESYAAFNEVDLFVGTVLTAQASGYDFNTNFYTADQADEGSTQIPEEATESAIEGKIEIGTEDQQPVENTNLAGAKTVSLDKITGKEDYKVLILEQNTDVVLKGEIVYVSDHVTVTGKKTATVSGEGTDSADAKLAYIIYK